MDLIPTLLAAAVLLPLLSFGMILVAGPKMGKRGLFAGYLATAAILGAAVLSFVSLSLWINGNPPVETAHHAESHDGQHDAAAGDHGDSHAGEAGSHDESEDHADGGGAGHSAGHDVDGTGTHTAEPATGHPAQVHSAQVHSAAGHPTHVHPTKTASPTGFQWSHTEKCQGSQQSAREFFHD